MSSRTIRILIADDHDMVRRGLRGLLETRSDLIIVAEASNGLEALELARATSPDIAILDYSMPGLNGHDLTVAIKRELPKTEVLIYTMHDRERIAIDVIRAGARGFVLKSKLESHLLEAINALSLNRPYFAGITEYVFENLATIPQRADLGTLTRRERQVAGLIAEGRINREVAQLLDISIKTVETHRAAAMHKLKLHTTAELVRYAVRNGLVTE